jgi:hypothetical protein
MRMLIPDVIFILRTAVEAQDLDLCPEMRYYYWDQEIGQEKRIFIL